MENEDQTCFESSYWFLICYNVHIQYIYYRGWFTPKICCITLFVEIDDASSPAMTAV